MGKIVKYKSPKKTTLADTKLPILLSNRLYLPAKQVTKKLMGEFTFQVGNVCKNCNCGDPMSCPSADVQQLEMFKDFQEGEYVGFQRGDIGKLKRLLRDEWDQVVDERSRRPMKYPVEFIGELRPNQKKTVKGWLKKKYGQIKSPPRSGKTVMIAYIVCKLGYQALILVHQDELAQQFYNTFMNINDGNIEFTNAPYLEKKHKKTMVGIARSIQDLDQNWPVTICNYQKFLRKPKLLKKMRDKWGQVWVDESHGSSANRWSQICSTLNPKVRAGCSATPKRKDGMHVIGENVLGPVTVEGTSDQMVCKVKFVETEHVVHPFKMYNTYISRLCADDRRNQKIVDQVIEDAEAGKHIMITTVRVGHAKKLTKMIEREGYSVACLVGNTPDRKQVLARFKKGKTQILVASRKITQVGLDIPIMDCLHLPMPNFNEYNLLQEVSRCRTPYDGKPQPLVRCYIDQQHKINFAVKNAFSKVFQAEKFEFEYTQPPKKKKSWS